MKDYLIKVVFKPHRKIFIYEKHWDEEIESNIMSLVYEKRFWIKSSAKRKIQKAIFKHILNDKAVQFEYIGDTI